MTIFELKDVLLTVGVPVSHYHVHKRPDKYIVWAEYGRHKLNADSQAQEKAIRVQVDYFTKTESDPNVEEIDRLLDGDDISSTYDVDHEKDTGDIRKYRISKDITI